MALKVINLTKNKERVLVDTVADVYVQTTENLWSGNNQYNAWKNAGYLQNGSVKITAEPVTKGMIDGSDFSKGFMINVEITSDQFFSAFEFEKLVNEQCSIMIPSINVSVNSIVLQMKMDGNMNTEGDARITLTGKRKVKRLIDCLYDAAYGNSLSYPWETGSTAGSGSSGMAGSFTS